MDRSTRRKAVTGIVVALCLAIDVYVAHPLWMSARLAGGQVLDGTFETADGSVVLRYSDGRGQFLPRVTLGETGDLSVPPGRTVVLPLEEGVTFRFRSPDAGAVPYLVLGGGVDRRTAGGKDAGHLPSGRLLSHGRSLYGENGGMELRDWIIDAPWSTDAARLASLWAACLGGMEDAVLALEIGSGRVTITLGACVIEAPLADRQPVAAALAGPYRLSIGREPAGWSTHSRLAPSSLAAAVAAAGFKAFSMARLFGPAANPAATLCLFVLHAGNPPAATILWLILVVALSVALTGIPLGRIWSRKIPSAVRYGLTVVATGAFWALVAAVALVALASVRNRQDHKERGMNGSETGCLLTGYSTAAGTTLLDGREGVGGLLAEKCPACNGRVETRARSAATFAFVRSAVCEPSGERGPGRRPVIFLGGFNDDYTIEPRDAPFAYTIGRIRVFLTARLHPLRFSFDLQTIADAFYGDRSRWQRHIERNLAEIGGAISCLDAAGDRFYFFHDFAVWDLPGGRPGYRQEMAKRRIRTILQAGGIPVDLLEATGRRAGVSWFNDMVHFSAAGHAAVAEIVCATVTADCGVSPKVPGESGNDG